MTTTITPQLITARITVFLWRVTQGETLVASGSASDAQLAQDEMAEYAKENHD
jgi:hypothetical protein